MHGYIKTYYTGLEVLEIIIHMIFLLQGLSHFELLMAWHYFLLDYVPLENSYLEFTAENSI